MPDLLFDHRRHHVGHRPHAFADLGFAGQPAFKPDIDDLRESPALEIVEHLAETKAGELYVVEPHVEELPHSLQGYEDVHFMTAEKAIGSADIVVVLVNHKVFQKVDTSLLKGKELIDTRGMWQ